MTGLARTILSLVFVAIMAVAAHAAERTIIVLDASGSMWGQIDGKPKLEIARETLRSVLKSVPADTELGLMAYGHREKGSCTDIQLVVPPAKGTESAISSAVDSMKFLGKTPLSAAVKQAAEDLKYTEEKSTVILITDGLETCGADPCAIAKELDQSGVDFTAHVVGFGLTAEEGKQVACLAENTGGKYIQATDASALEDALKQTVAAAPPTPEPTLPSPPAPAPAKVEFNLLPKTFLKEGGDAPKIDVYYEVFKVDASGGKSEPADSGYAEYKANLAPGNYIVSSKSGYASAEQMVSVVADKPSEPVFDLNAGALMLRAKSSPGSEPDSNAQIIVDYPGEGDSTANYGEVKTVVPVGDTKVTVKLGAAEVSETITLAAGQTIDKDIIVAVGRVTTDAFYIAGGEKVDSGDLAWRIYKAAKKMDGTREQVAYDFGAGRKFALPAGDYIAEVQMQGVTTEHPFAVKVDDAIELKVPLNAGVLAITAPGASEIRILEAKANLQGDRAGVTYGYGESFQTTLAAGDYIVVTAKGDAAKKETPVTIKAGERKGVKVE